MFDDYYSFHPTIQLSESICVTGFFGTPVPQTIRFVQALSGVPVIDLERLIEHRIGERIAHYLLKHHIDDLFLVEHQILQQLNEQPSLIILRPSTLRFRRNFDLLQGFKGLSLIQSVEQLALQLDAVHQDGRFERFIDIDGRLPISNERLQAEVVVWKRYLPSAWVRYTPMTIAPSGIAGEILTVLQKQFIK